MRTMRLTLVGGVVVALLVGLGAGVLAQTDELTPTTATGTLEFLEPVPEAMIDESSESIAHDEGAVHVHGWTSSDPRLTGTATYTGKWHLYEPPAEDCDNPEAEAGAVYEIASGAGGWRCAGFRAPIPGPDGARNVHTLAFRGTGEYEGLSAYIIVDWSASPYAFSALITPNDVAIVPVLPG